MRDVGPSQWALVGIALDVVLYLVFGVWGVDMGASLAVTSR